MYLDNKIHLLLNMEEICLLNLMDNNNPMVNNNSLMDNLNKLVMGNQCNQVINRILMDNQGTVNNPGIVNNNHNINNMEVDMINILTWQVEMQF